MIVQPDADEATARGASLQVAPILEAAAVEHRFRNGRGIGPVDLRIVDGERTAIMGSNGAGKTTLMRILATATRPRRGTVRWYGSAQARVARCFIGYAADSALDDAGLSGRQSSYFWCSRYVRRGTIGPLVDDALARFGLAAVADEPLARYSFGMRRRLALAQAFAHHPRLALLDEPTAGLDANGLEALRFELLHRSERGEATLVASNDCGFVATACERVIFLDQGYVVVDDTPERLLASVGDARRVEMDVADAARPFVDQLETLAGVVNTRCVDGAVSVELLDDSALGSLVRVVDSWPGGLLALRVHKPDLSDAFRSLTGKTLHGDRETR